jgi:hypothetical protein
MWLGRAVNVEHFRVPLSTCWAYIEIKNREDTLSAVRFKGIFIGYARNTRSYLVLDESTSRIYARRYADVKFDERMAAPSDGRVMLELNDTRTIPVLVQGGETPASSNHTLALDQGGAKPVVSPKGLITHGGTTFMTLAKNRTVLELARMFKVSGEVYLSYLREYDGWYQTIINTRSVIQKGADVPVYITTTKRTGSECTGSGSRHSVDSTSTDASMSDARG